MLDKILKSVKITVWVIFGICCIISTWWSIATSKTFFLKWKNMDEDKLFEEDEEDVDE